MILFGILVAVGCLAFANGANDNFKGVATLFGSGTASFRNALSWATATTFAGSIAAVFLAEKLLKAFGGRGLVPDELASQPAYAAAVALGAGLTVLLATRVGMPISTTHGIVGALIGAGFAAGVSVDVGRLGKDFVLPLLVSPLIALTATLVVYPIFRVVRRRLGVQEETCFCIGAETREIAVGITPTLALAHAQRLSLEWNTTVECRRRYAGRVIGVEASKALDALHYVSAGAVSFARGLNDTPKIAALLLLAAWFGPVSAIAVVGVVIAIGGLLNARRVAETMSKKITPMNHGQGFTANLLTAAIVVNASLLGMPVSTTHVSCGSIFGIGLLTQQADYSMIGKILASWVFTLPVGALLGAASFSVMRLVS
jgi:inorganic phosphate transporter, PiT family